VSCAKPIACLSAIGLKRFVSFHLTLWRPVYEYIVPGFQPKTSSFPLPYQCHSSSAECAKELFKGSNRSASLLVCTRKKCFGCGLRIFCEWCKWSSSWVILAHVAWPRAQPLGQPCPTQMACKLSQKLCHCLNQGCTLNNILMRATHWMAYFDLRN